MKQLLKQWLIVLLLTVPSVQAQPAQSIDLDQLYHKLSQATSARVKAVPMPSCSFITEDKALIQALIDIFKKTDVKQISENESFFYRSYQTTREGASSVKFTLNDGAVVTLGFGLGYTYEPTVDVMLFLPNQQQVPLSADWTINRELFHWARKIGKPTVFLHELRAHYEEIEFDAFIGNEAYSRNQQRSRIASCTGIINRNSYYRDPTIFQTCGDGFYQRHPDVCGSGWTPAPQDVE